MNNLTNKQIIFYIDGSFFLEKSPLVLAYILAFIDNKIILHYKFIITIALNYYYSCLAKICSTLRIWIILDEYAPIEKISKIRVSISTDCQVVINSLNKLEFHV